MHGVVLYLRWIDRGVVRLLGKRPGMYEPGQRSVLPRSLRETGGLVTIQFEVLVMFLLVTEGSVLVERCDQLEPSCRRSENR